MSNNHVLDCQISGYEDTCAEAARVGARIFGAGHNVDEARAPMILSEEGGIGILSVCYRRAYRATEDKEGTLFWYDDEIIEKTIREVKEKCRFCVVIAHAGEEFSPLPLVTHVFWQNYRRARLFLRPWERAFNKEEFLVKFRKERVPSAVASVLRARRRFKRSAWRRENAALVAYILEKAKK